MMSEKGPQLDFAKELLGSETKEEDNSTESDSDDNKPIEPVGTGDKPEKKATRIVRDPSDGSTYEVPL